MARRVTTLIVRRQSVKNRKGNRCYHWKILHKKYIHITHNKYTFPFLVPFLSLVTRGCEVVRVWLNNQMGAGA